MKAFVVTKTANEFLNKKMSRKVEEKWPVHLLFYVVTVFLSNDSHFTIRRLFNFS